MEQALPRIDAPEPPQLRSYEDIMLVAHELTRHDSQPIEGGWYKPDPEDLSLDVDESLGLRVDLASPELGIKPEEMWLALYTNDTVEQQSRGISEALGMEVRALGHLEFRRTLSTTSTAQTSGNLYFLENRNILVVVDGIVKGDDPLSEESEACYDLLNQLGIADFWVKEIMFKHERGDIQKGEQRFCLEEAQAMTLLKFLREYLPGRI